MLWTLKRKQSTQVGWSLQMLRELPALADDPDASGVARVAALDAFFSHARGLAEFLIGSRDKRLIQRHDFLPNWEVTDPEQRDALGRLLGLATTHVSHLSKARVPAVEADVLERVGRTELNTFACAVFASFADFVEAMETAGADLSDQMRIYLDDATGTTPGTA